MRVLVACEFSGRVRDAFLARGHDAYSCDLLPSNGPHYQGDVFDVAYEGWDLMIAHPPCTYLCNSGVRWLKNSNQRVENMWEASKFFQKLWCLPIPKICIENPIPHRYGNLPKYTQIIQPWQFGHGETKATCLWLKDLPALEPTRVVKGRKGKIHLMSPGPDRGRLRSITYQGIANAFAAQWG